MIYITVDLYGCAFRLKVTAAYNYQLTSLPLMLIIQQNTALTKTNIYFNL